MFIDPFFLPHSYSANVYLIKNRYVSVILKNGSSSLHQYASENNIQITDVKEIFSEELNLNKKIVIDVVIKDPIDRYYSALHTVNDMYNLPDSVPTLERVKRHSSDTGIFLDNHFYPQYLFAIAAFVQSWCSTNLYFKFIDISELNNFVGDIRNNFRLNKQPYNDATEKHTIRQKYFFDMKIYNHLIGKTINFVELLDFFSQSIDEHFTNENLHMPRWAHYLKQVNPENHVDNHHAEIAKYTNVFGNFIEEYNKINRN